MKKISNLLMMALLAIGMGLTSCDEQLDNAVVPGVTPGTDEGEVTSITVDLSKIDEKYLDTEKTKLQLTVGDEVTLSFTILPEEMASTEVELTAADATILSIDGLKVKALKEGETKVTAKAGEKTAECKVTVAATAEATAAKTLAEATAGDIGKIAGKDGKIYATKADAEAVATGNAVAKIIYVGSSTGDATYNHGLALALTDESSSGMDWNNAKTACTNKNTSATVKSASWMLPSKTQWETMGATSSTYTTLLNGFTSVGGSNLESRKYWSSTENEDTPDLAWVFFFGNGDWSNGTHKDDIGPLVRACLAF